MLEAALDKNHLGQALAGRRVLLTGHTGFKGGWLALWLRRPGADTTAVALLPGDGQPRLPIHPCVGAFVDQLPTS